MHSVLFAVARCPLISLFVCPFITTRYCVETAKLIGQILSPPINSSIFLSFSELNRVPKFQWSHMTFKWQGLNTYSA